MFYILAHAYMLFNNAMLKYQKNRNKRRGSFFRYSYERSYIALSF